MHYKRWRKFGDDDYCFCLDAVARGLAHETTARRKGEAKRGDCAPDRAGCSPALQPGVDLVVAYLFPLARLCV